MFCNDMSQLITAGPDTDVSFINCSNKCQNIPSITPLWVLPLCLIRMKDENKFNLLNCEGTVTWGKCSVWSESWWPLYSDYWATRQLLPQCNTYSIIVQYIYKQVNNMTFVTSFTGDDWHFLSQLYSNIKILDNIQTFTYFVLNVFVVAYQSNH